MDILNKISTNIKLVTISLVHIFGVKYIKTHPKKSFESAFVWKTEELQKSLDHWKENIKKFDQDF